MKTFMIALYFAAVMMFLAPFTSSAIMARQPTQQLTASATPVAQSGKAHLESDVEVNFDKKDAIASVNGGFITDNWGVIALSLLAFAETIVRLTPTQKDNSILKILSTILNAIIPNKKAGGGVF